MKQRIAWAICEHSAGLEIGCACRERGDTICASTEKVTERVTFLARFGYQPIGTDPGAPDARP